MRNNKTKKILMGLFLSILINFSHAQNEQLKVEKLKLNSAPAFVILGIEPDNIQRPSSPSQFIAGLQNSFVNGKLKPNVAFEVSPYFMANPKKNPKRFDPKEYLLTKNGGVINTIYKSLSLSLATSESDTVVFGNLNAGTGLGFGIRFLLIDGRPNADLLKWNNQQLIASYFNSISGTLASLPPSSDVDIKLIIDKVTTDFINESIKNLSISSRNEEIKKALLKEKDDLLFELITKKIKSDSQSLLDFFEEKEQAETEQEGELLTALNKKKNPFAKEGFMLEFGAGHASVFQGNDLNDVKSAKAAFWLTPSFRWSLSKDGQEISLIDFMGVFRYTINNKKDSVDVADYFDAGVKGQFTHNKWSGSLEFIGRWASEVPTTTKSNYTYRLAVSIDYKISDAVTFKFTFGSNFDGNTSTYSKPKEMFVLGGLNLGIFNPKENK